MLDTSTAASTSSVPRCCVQSCAGAISPSQSTMRPIIANSSASNAPIATVNSVIAAMYLRVPSEQAHRKANNPFGGGTGAAAG